MNKQNEKSQKVSESNLNLENNSTIASLAKAAYESQNWGKLNDYLEEYLETNKEAKQLVLQFALEILTHSDFNNRWEVAKLFKKIGRESIVSLINLAEDENQEPEVRWFACRILGEFNYPETILTLVKLLQNLEEEIASAAAQGLAYIGSDAVELLSAQLKEPHSRLLVVQALGGIRKPEVITPLISVVSDPNPDLRATAIEALGSFHEPRITQVLIAALKDTSAKVRKEAVTALGRRSDLFQDINLVKVIKPLLYDFNVEVCLQAAHALGRIGTKEASDELFQVQSSKATPTELKVLLIKSLLLTETIEGLLCFQNLLYISEFPVVQEIISVLGRIESPTLQKKASQIILKYFDSQAQQLEAASLKQAIANSLGELGEPTALRVLEKLGQDPTPAVRLHAQAAIKKLTQL